MVRPPALPPEEQVRIVLSIPAGEMTVTEAAQREGVGAVGRELVEATSTPPDWVDWESSPSKSGRICWVRSHSFAQVYAVLGELRKVVDPDRPTLRVPIITSMQVMRHVGTHGNAAEPISSKDVKLFELASFSERLRARP